jgi:spermidine/putrescine transport system ATP-binding protein
MEPALYLKNLVKTYGDTIAVDGIDLTIDSGRFVTLLGPSGCGKSTTLRMIGGFETPDTGQILIGDKDITNIPPHRRPVNMVFQDYALFPHLTVKKNISFGLELNGTPKNRIVQRVDELLEMMQITEHAEKSPHHLSGGQRQRVALARALAPDPQVLLLDEPLSALDAKLRQQMQFELRGLQRKTGKTFILVTHDQSEALTISDTIVVMNEGRIEQIGSPTDLYRRPRSPFVANFVGETNILECRVEAVGKNRVKLKWYGQTLHADCPNGASPPVGKTLKVALRPEAIRCSADEPTGFSNRMTAGITQRIFEGARTRLTLAPGGVEQALSASVAPIEADTLADTLWIGWGDSDLVLLDWTNQQEIVE